MAPERVHSPYARIHERSARNLDNARSAAASSRGYNSENTRAEMSRLFRERSNGRIPYNWQLDVSEAFLLGLNSIVIAGTGAGKTIPFMLPLLVEKDKKIVIISPLKALQRDQCRRFKKMGISACALNGDTWGPRMKKKLQSNAFQAIMTSPEMCLEHAETRQLFSSAEFSKNIIGFVVDEAHCISQWGGDFRKSYGMLDKLRAFVASCTPFLATSATITPPALGEITGKLNINLEKSFYLNLGNDRPNVTPSVMEMKNQKDFAALKDLVANGIVTPEDLTKTIIFTNSIRLTMQIRRYLRKILPASCHAYVDAFHALRTPKAKRRIMKKFYTGDVKILVATEAAGMVSAEKFPDADTAGLTIRQGADIPDIELVIQFGVPSSLEVWTQRAGRAGRSPDIQARAILLVEKSMFQRRKSKSARSRGNCADNADDEDLGAVDEWDDLGDDEDVGEVNNSPVDPASDGKDWAKKVDPSLRHYIETLGCRRDASDKYFNNPPRLSYPTGQCCDRCMTPSTANERPQTPTMTHDPVDPPPSQSHNSTPHSSPSKTQNRNGKRQMGPRSEHPKVRRDEHLKKARAVLERWRLDTKRAHYTPSSFTAAALLPDTILTTLASNGTIRTLDDLKSVLKTPWILADDHGEEVIALLRQVDEERLREMEAKKKRRKVTAARPVPLDGSSTFNVVRPPQNFQLLSSTSTIFTPSTISFPMPLAANTPFPAYLASPTFFQIPVSQLPACHAPSTITPYFFYGTPPQPQPPRS